jgi:hypothetical protein
MVRTPAGERLHLERAQAPALAGAHIGLERRLVLGGVQRRRLRVMAERRPRAPERDLVEPARRRIERGVDARHLLLEQHVAALLLLRKALVVGVLERLEGAHQVAVRHQRVGRQCALRDAGHGPGLGFEFGRHIHSLSSG